MEVHDVEVSVTVGSLACQPFDLYTESYMKFAVAKPVKKTQTPVYSTSLTQEFTAQFDAPVRRRRLQGTGGVNDAFTCVTDADCNDGDECLVTDHYSACVDSDLENSIGHFSCNDAHPCP